MLIDAGQVFRCLVVAATNREIDLNDPAAIDEFLGNEQSVEECVGFVKAVYHMQKVDRDALLYTPEVGVNSARIGARPLSQAFKDELLRKWLRDAGEEGFDIVLLDGRALEEVGIQLEALKLCYFIAGLYFVCDAKMGAMRTLGFAGHKFEDLSDVDAQKVTELMSQITERNRADSERTVQPIVRPAKAPVVKLPELYSDIPKNARFMATVDTSAPMLKIDMATPVIRIVATVLDN